MANKYLSVRVRDSQEVMYEGEADRVTSRNEEGPFDVFPLHANFISIIKDKVVLYKDGHLIKEIKVEKAVMKVKKDEVHIFLGIEAFVVDSETGSMTRG